jgi:hypothetical protein
MMADAQEPPAASTVNPLVSSSDHGAADSPAVAGTPAAPPGDAGGGLVRAVAEQLATRPLRVLGLAGATMLALSAWGMLVEPITMDASVDGFLPRGTPVAVAVNTGILLQQGLAEKTLRQYPLPDCAAPPLELWLALCTETDMGASHAGGGARAISGFLQALPGRCSLLCAQALVPWVRECTVGSARGAAAVDAASAIAAAVGKLLGPWGLQSLQALLAASRALGRGAGPGCADLAACVDGLLASCSKTFEANLYHPPATVWARQAGP